MSGKYNSYKQSTLDSSCSDLTTVVVKAMLCSDVDFVYTAGDNFMNDVEGYRYPGTTDQTLTTKTITNGVFKSDPVTYSGVALSGGKDADVIVLYVDTAGVSSTDPIIAYYDAFTGVTPNGNNITITPNASGWFEN